jgi:hypothetical protein
LALCLFLVLSLANILAFIFSDYTLFPGLGWIGLGGLGASKRMDMEVASWVLFRRCIGQ